MSTQPTPTPKPDPKAALSGVLNIITLALQGIELAGPLLGPEGAIASAAAGTGIVFWNILQHALATYRAQTGQPIDLKNIPLEALEP